MIDDERLHRGLREPLQRLPAAEPRPERVARRARVLRFRRYAAAAVATFILATGVVVPLAVLSSVHGNAPHHRMPAATTGAVDRFGIRITLPDGWTGRVFQEYRTTWLQAANYELPADEPDAASQARGNMGPGDVTIVMFSRNCPCGNDYPQTQLPISFSKGDFPGGSFEGVPADHAFAPKGFTVNGRAFDLWVEFGTTPAPDALLAQVNATLATMQIEGSSGWETHTDQDDGLVISTPANWAFKEDPVPNLAEPKILFATGSYDFPTGGDCGPEPALQALPDDGVLLWLTEYRVPENFSDFPFRPTSFRLEGEPVTPECATSAPQYLIRFRDGFRFFQVQVALGAQAADALRQDVVDSLNSISEEPLSEQETLSRWLDLCDKMQWVLCPFSDWVRNTIWDAGFLVDGRTDNAIVGSARGTGFLMWTRPEGRGPQPVNARTIDVDGALVYLDGSSAVWRTRGVEVVVKQSPDQPAFLSDEQISALVRASVKEPIA